MSQSDPGFSAFRGPVTFWESPDGRIEFVKWGDGLFTLHYDGVEVMDFGTFEQITYYYWAEFHEA